MKTATNFINPEIASLIEAKREISELVEQTKKAEQDISERENLILQELEAMSKRMDDFQSASKKLRTLLKVIAASVGVSLIISLAVYFHR